MSSLFFRHFIQRPADGVAVGETIEADGDGFVGSGPDAEIMLGEVVSAFGAELRCFVHFSTLRTL